MRHGTRFPHPHSAKLRDMEIDCLAACAYHWSDTYSLYFECRNIARCQNASLGEVFWLYFLTGACSLFFILDLWWCTCGKAIGSHILTVPNWGIWSRLPSCLCLSLERYVLTLFWMQKHCMMQECKCGGGCVLALFSYLTPACCLCYFVSAMVSVILNPWLLAVVPFLNCTCGKAIGSHILTVLTWMMWKPTA